MYSYSEDNRVFNYAVAASVVLHALLLFGISQRDRARPAEPPVPLVARLVELPASAPAAAPPQAEPIKPRPRSRPVAPKPVPKEESLTPPEPVQEAAPAESPVPEVLTPAPTEGPAAPPVISRADPAPAAPPAAAEPIADPGSLEKYRYQLVDAARSYKRYPRIATDNDWKGRVALRMVMAPSGRIASMRVTKTSGYDVLDQQALEMFRKAAEVVPVPPVLRGKEFAVEVGVDYYFTD